MNTAKIKYVKMAHIIANQDCQACTDEVEKFCKNKLACQQTWSTTSLIVGGNQNGSMLQAQTIVITTCLIHWEYTEAQAQSYWQEQRAKTGIIKSS